MSVYLDAGSSADWPKGKTWSMTYMTDEGDFLAVSTADQFLFQMGANDQPVSIAKRIVMGFMELRASDAMPDSIFDELMKRGLIE